MLSYCEGGSHESHTEQARFAKDYGRRLGVKMLGCVAGVSFLPRSAVGREFRQDEIQRE